MSSQIPHSPLPLTIPDTTLLDRAAALEAEKAANAGTSTQELPSQAPASSAPANDGTAQTKRELAEALRANGQLKLRIAAAEKELVTLRSKTKTDTTLIEDLSKQRTLLVQKVRDRDEELKGKAKFIVVCARTLCTLDTCSLSAGFAGRDHRAEFTAGCF